MKRQSYLTKMIVLCLFAFFLDNADAQTCPSGLLSYWKMNGLNGTTITDYAGGHNAISNNPNLVIDEIGEVGSSLFFNTTEKFVGDKANVPNHADYGFAAYTSFTIVYWMKCTEVNYNSQDHCLISKGDWKGGAPTTAFWSSGINGSGAINFILQDANSARCEMETPTGNYNDGNWHQVAFVRSASGTSGAGTNYIYVDGVAVVTTSFNYTGNFTNSNDIQFASLLSSSVFQYFYKGSIDEVAIYNRALGSSEVLTQFDNAEINGMGICDGNNPVFNSMPKVKATVGVLYSYTAHASGIQTGLTYSLITGPSGMTINQSTGLVQWTPTSITQNGLVSIRANNPTYPPADTQTFRINLATGNPCPDNLQVLLKLNETNGPVYADQYGEHNATATTSPTSIEGIVDGGQNFSSATKIDIPDNGTEFEWTASSDFSIECWMKPSNIANPGMIALGRTNIWEGSEYAHWSIGVNSSGYATFELFDNHDNGDICTGTTLMTDGNWHHVVAVRDGTNHINKLYVDGVLQDSKTPAYTVTFNSDVQPNPLNLGYIKRASGSAEDYNFIGGLDELAIFDVALSEANITSFYNGGNPVGHCSDGNYAPVITSTPVTTVNELTPYSYTFTVDDIDESDVLTLSAPVKPSWLTFNWTAGQKTATLTGTPGTADVGNHNVTLRVYDQKVQIDQAFVINVSDVNSEPEVTSTAITNTNEDEAYSYTVTVTDVDAGDVIGMTAVTKPSWLAFNYTAGAKTASLTGTPAFADVGNHNVSISITDQHHTIYHNFTITVSAVNDAPVISAQSALSTNEDVAITLQKANFTISDEDNSLSEITLKVQAGTNYTFVGNTITPAQNFNGTLTVNVIASDLTDDSQVYQASVTVNPVNDPPVITSADPSTQATVGTLYSYVFTASDVDDATLTYSVVQKPDWLTFTSNNGVLTGTPASGNKGQHLVILRVSDGKIDVDKDFVITVTGPDGIESFESQGISVYPVPTRDYLEISFEKAMKEIQAEVITSVGQIIKKVVIPADTNHYLLDLDGLNAGTYYLRLRYGTTNSIGKIAIIK